MHVPDHVAASPEDVCPLLNGMRISQLTLSTADGAPFDLAAPLSAKPAVLVFYRGGW
jgi:peroxiredoxin